MKTFDFNNPENWHFSALVYLYSPASEDYAEVVGYLMEDVEEANNAYGSPMWGWEDARDNCTDDSRFDHKGTCDHCGAHFHYGAAYMNDEGEFAIVGNVCASNKLNLTAHEYAAKKMKAAVKAAKSKVAGDKVIAALLPNRRAVLETDHYIVANIKSALRKWHSLSLKQWALVKKIARDQAAQAEAKANEPDPVAIPTELTAGRHTISGVLLGTKSEETPYGWSTKMLVLDDRGFKLWGTLPSAISGIDKGDRLTFDAAVQVSDKDECFGFIKRPTKAQFESTNTEETS